LKDRTAGSRGAVAHQGRRPGDWGCNPLPWSALGAGGRPQAKRAGGMVAPLWGAIADATKCVGILHEVPNDLRSKSSEYTTCSGPPEAARQYQRTSPLGNFLE